MIWTIESGGEVLGPFKCDGRVHGVSAGEQRDWCLSLGGRLPTAAEFDRIWLSADVRVLPRPRDVTKAPLDALHDDVLDAWRLGGELPDPRVCCGKTWVSGGGERALNYGWHVPTSDLPPRANFWRGIKVYPSSIGNAHVIQPVGDAHGWNHADYSQIGYCVRPVDATERPTRPELPPPPSMPSPPWPSATMLGEKGPAVVAWQRRLKLQAERTGDRLFDPGAADGRHGPRTEAATLHAFAVVAELDDERERLGVAPPVPPPPVVSDEPEVIQARNFRRGRSAPVRLVVLHSTENPIRRGVARNVARWFAGPNAPMASAHYVVGPDEVLQGVHEHDTAFAAPGANHDGIQIELVGQALTTAWLIEGDNGRCGRAVLKRAAPLVAALCRRHELPVRAVDAGGLLRGERGITTHAAVGEAFKKSTHVDPGGPGDKRWPWIEFLRMVERA